MTTITAIFNAYGPEYIQRFPNLPPSHLKTIHAICTGRTGNTGYSLSLCQSCGGQHRLAHACGNRHCPQCQPHTTQLWLHNQLDKQLPGPHCLITFTVPESLRPFCRAPPKLAYHTLFQASSEALKTLARDARFLGTDLPGFTGILHTWGRQLPYHPHIHDLVPGGGLATQRNQWRPSRTNFSVPVKALSPIYRALFKRQMAKAQCLERIDPKVWSTPWNVHSQANPGSSTALKYLAPYVFKVAISNHRLVSCKDRIVTFTYRQSGSNRPRTLRLEVIEFLRRFLQHVLPTGFMQVRHFGFLHPNCTSKTPDIRRLITAQNGITFTPLHATDKPAFDLACPHCGAQLHRILRLMPWNTGFVDTG